MMFRKVTRFGPVLRLLCAALLLTGWISGCRSKSEQSNATDTRASHADVDERTEVVKYGTLQKQMTLAGQVNPTEHGRADLTTALQGIVIRPLVKVGQFVEVGQPVAEINSVYGQTPMQLAQKTDADEAAVVTAQNAWQQAIATLGQARASLAQADTTLSQSVDNLGQAKAEITNAENDYHRKVKLEAAGVFAKSDVDDARERLWKAREVLSDMREEIRIARRGVEIARKNIVPAEENVRLTKNSIHYAQLQVDHDHVIAQGALNPQGSKSTQFYIRSSIAGTVVAVNMSSGQAVSPGTILASVVDTSRVYVDASAYASDLEGVHVGDPMEVHADGVPDRVFKGVVSVIGKQMDPSTRTVPVRCLVQNQNGLLRTGLFVQAHLNAMAPRKALIVANTAVLIDGSEHYVIVKSGDGKYRKRKIVEGVRTDSGTEVLSGLKAGETVVTDGNILVVPE